MEMTALVQAPATLQSAAELAVELSDDDLDLNIEVADFVEGLNRVFRVERGRRTEGRKGAEVLPGGISQTERNRRSEEMLVARYVDGDPEGFTFVAANGWRKCVNEARTRGFGSDQPSRVSKPRLGNGVTHPARYSDPVLKTMAEVLPEAGVVLDPFAGTGRIHELATEDRQTVGVEIEPEWAELHPDTRIGNALDLAGTAHIEPESVDAIATSPTYGNRLADHHQAKDADSRRSYTHDLGHALHDDNSGAMQWGDEYRIFHEKAYREAIAALKPGGQFVVNISDHIRSGEWQAVSFWHLHILTKLGLDWNRIERVETRRLKQGANADKRSEYEYVIVMDKPGS